jgi:hypothetical protein
MPDLATFQRAFIRSISETPACSGAAVYRNTALLGVVDALRANYPVAEAIIGEAMFANIASEFASAHPPRTPVLAEYGKGFATWIRQQPWSVETPYLSDVARLERLHIEALFAADTMPLSADMMAGVDPGDWQHLQLQLHPATRFGWIRTPALQIWRAHQGNLPSTFAPDWHAEGALFARPHGEVTAHILDLAAYRFLGSICRGKTIGAAALATALRHPRTNIGALFAALVGHGSFVAPQNFERN